jgi:hypothetical protein
MSDVTGMELCFTLAAVTAFFYVVLVAEEKIKLKSMLSYMWAATTLGWGLVAVFFLGAALHH